MVQWFVHYTSLRSSQWWTLPLKINMSDMCEQWHALKFLVKSNKKQFELCLGLKNVFGDACMKQSSYLRWHSKFWNGRESYKLEGGPGAPVTVLSEETINAADSLCYAGASNCGQAHVTEKLNDHWSRATLFEQTDGQCMNTDTNVITDDGTND